MNKLLIYEQRTIDIDDNLIYKKPAIHQECFVKDVIGYGLLYLLYLLYRIIGQNLLVYLYMDLE